MLDRREQLTGEFPMLNLPSDRPQSSTSVFESASEPFQLPYDLSHGLRNLASNTSTTLFVTLLAAFQVLLHRYTDQDDIPVGALATDPWSDPVVLCADVSGNPSFRSVLQQMHQTVRDAFRTPDDPLRPSRDTSICRVGFALMQPQGMAAAWEIEAEWRTDGDDGLLATVGMGQGWSDLVLAMVDGGDPLVGAVHYNRELFDAATIERMVYHFHTLLESIVANPEQVVSELPFLRAAERHEILVVWNATQTAYPCDQPIHKLIEEQASQTPEAMAVVWEAEHLTYRALNQRANQVAHYLLALGIGPETLVALCVERSLEMVVGLLGILKAGGAYVPLDPAYPKERLAFMLADAQAPVLLTQGHLADELPAETARVICLDRDWPTLASQRRDNPGCTVSTGNLAYVIYTSGSTGHPKGVLVEHGGLLNLIGWHHRAYGVTAQDRASPMTSLSFDVCGWEMWPYLAVGSRLDLVPSALLSAPEMLRDWLVQRGISISFVPTPVAEHLVTLAWLLASGFHQMLTGGDTLHQSPPCGLPFSLINNYGPTESTVVATAIEVRPEELGTPPIGYAIDNVQVYLLDRYGEAVPVGIAGELCTGGESLARGYHHRPGLTAEKFVANGYGACRLYRTGDLARYRSDGCIEFLGRLDNQVKVRGFRIELGEIEAVLNQHPTVQDTVVIVREDQPGDRRLVAYVMATEQGWGDDGPTAILRVFLQQTLPDYMVPSAFVGLDAWPLTPNGKIDRRALPAPTHRPELGTDYVMPQTEAERHLASIWREVLQVDQVGIHDNFFDLGGHSLLLPQIYSKLEPLRTDDFTLVDLFRYPTIHALTERLNRQPHGQPEDVRQGQGELRQARRTATRERRTIRQKMQS